MSIESVMASDHLILCCPLLLLPSVFPSIRVFSNESTLPMRWPKYWSFSFTIIPSKEIPGLISFRMDLLDLLAVHRTLKSLYNGPKLILHGLGSTAVATGQEKVSFHSNPKERQCQRMLKLLHNCTYLTR